MRPSNPPRNVASFKNAETVATAPQLRAAACDGALSASHGGSQCFISKCSVNVRFKAVAFTDRLGSFALVRCNERAARAINPFALVIKNSPGCRRDFLGLWKFEQRQELQMQLVNAPHQCKIGGPHRTRLVKTAATDVSTRPPVMQL